MVEPVPELTIFTNGFFRCFEKKPKNFRMKLHVYLFLSLNEIIFTIIIYNMLYQNFIVHSLVYLYISTFNNA